MNQAYEGLKPVEIWRHFDQLNGIPRGSTNEAAAREYVLQVARQAGLRHAVDGRGNCVVYVPATDGGDAVISGTDGGNTDPVIVQSHLDMVLNPPPADAGSAVVTPRRDGDAIFASGTTLGADNGIGVAAALALITTPGLSHGPLELLFTVEEEIGMFGASDFDASLLSGKRLVNLDSEELDVVTIGCAGGRTFTITIPAAGEATPHGWDGCEVRVSGLRGGHSGIEIAKRRANANKILATLLKRAENAGIDFRLADIAGGEARNAIPANARALVTLKSGSLQAFSEIVAAAQAELQSKWGADEPGLTLTASPVQAPELSISIEAYEGVVTLIDDLPTGVVAMSPVYHGKVQTSQNVAVVQTAPGTIAVGVSTRSFLEGDLDTLEEDIREKAREEGATVVCDSGYPGWPPAGDSPLLRRATAALGEVLGRDPEIEVVHAGLECGVIASKIPGLEAVSFGPDIRDAHRTTEHVLYASVEPFWRALLRILAPDTAA